MGLLAFSDAIVAVVVDVEWLLRASSQDGGWAGQEFCDLRTIRGHENPRLRKEKSGVANPNMV